MSKILAVTLTMLVLAAAGAWWKFRVDWADARERLLAGSRIATTACGPIEYAVAGAGPVVLAIHGAGGGYGQMADFAETLAAEGFQVIAMSRFGYLRTPMPADASPAAQADAHACLLDALDVRAAAAFGASAGAPSAMQFCLRHRDRCSALVLLVPVAFAPGRGAGDTTPPSPFMQVVLDHVLTSDFVIWAVTRLAPAILVETVLATPKPVFDRAGKAEQQRALRMIHDIFPVGPKLAGLANDSAIAAAVPRYELAAITAPALVISVQDDLYGTFAGAAYTAEHLPDARLVGYATGGHGWLGHHGEVQATIVSFLREQ